MRCVVSLMVLLICSACMQAPEPDIYASYTSRGGPAPATIAIAPLLDRANCNLPWSVSAEITNGVREQMADSYGIYVLPREKTDPVFDRIPVEELYGREATGAARLQGTDFLLLMELMSHTEVPYQRKQLQLRLRILDLRGEEPRLVLQEIIHNKLTVNKGLSWKEVDYALVKWPSDDYLRTPVGRAHARLARDVAKQVEHYVNYAQG